MEGLGHVCACLKHSEASSGAPKLVARSDQPRGRRAQASRSSAACTLFQGGSEPAAPRKKAGAGNTPHFFLSHSL